MHATTGLFAKKQATGATTDATPFGPNRVRLTARVLLTVAFIACETLAVAMMQPAALAVWGAVGPGMGLAYTTLGLTMLEQADPGQEGDDPASLQFATLFGFVAAIGLPRTARPPSLDS